MFTTNALKIASGLKEQVLIGLKTIVYIQKQNKIYELKKVNWLRGTTVSVYGMAKAGMLVIQSEKKKIVLVSSQTKSVDSFADSELLRIFEKILEHNTELKKDDALDFWYEIRK